ncbi:hypothetical protein MCNS_24800 [Mycobacterium conspicuum]|uniref:Rv2525c-like glycoside hydrolase-like domain-containing protein n=1 Tax=Mycobacterium conspicuum TaxID=44010 RepID=A0A7I7YCZ7_9MYCO|nr:hypothetical protein MCNS_24800 [Mycobacterium conspicuum]
MSHRTQNAPLERGSHEAYRLSAREILPDQIKAAGYGGVITYVSESRPGDNFGAKPATRKYADALRTVGLEIVSNFQYGKPNGSAPSDFTRGFDGGGGCTNRPAFAQRGRRRASNLVRVAGAHSRTTGTN